MLVSEVWASLIAAARCSFEDPFALRLFYEALATVFTIVRVTATWRQGRALGSAR